MATESPAPLRADAERNRRRILAAAAEAFAEHGIDAGVDDIARRAGVGIATLYRRFPTKDHLVLELLKERYSQHIVVARRSLEIADPWEAFTELMRGMVRMRAEDRTYDEVLTAGRYYDHPDINELRDESHRVLSAVLARVHEAQLVRPGFGYGDLVLGLHGQAAIARQTRGVAPNFWERSLAIFLAGLRVPDPLPGSEPSRDDLRSAFKG